MTTAAALLVAFALGILAARSVYRTDVRELTDALERAYEEHDELRRLIHPATRPLRTVPRRNMR